MKFDVVIVAGGTGSRSGMDKLHFNLSGTPLLERTTSAFLGVERVNRIILVMRSGDEDFGYAIKESFGSEKIVITTGDSTRGGSVKNGLLLCGEEGVLVHDGARPYVDEELIERVMDSVESYGSAVPALPITDSIREVEGKIIVGEVDRDRLYRVQTPQGFLRKELVSAYSHGENCTDESLLYTRYVKGARLVEGSERNVKLTTQGDFISLNARVGMGYDLHKLALFRKFMLGGVEISYEMGAVAHSDGDVVIHALIDALLGAIGERDIGTLFPDNDPKYLDIDSSIMLSEVMEILRKKNYKVATANVIIVLEKPKIGDYIPVMRLKLARLLGISLSDMTISAKTNEGLGEIGEGKAVSAYATVTVV